MIFSDFFNDTFNFALFFRVNNSAKPVELWVEAFQSIHYEAFKLLKIRRVWEIGNGLQYFALVSDGNLVADNFDG